MKKFINIFNIIMFFAIMLSDVFYIIYGGIVLKGVTSGLFVLLGVVNLIYAIITKSDKLKFAIIITIGLVFAMLGDVVLEFNFIAGAALFAIGHIFFFVSYCVLSRFRWRDLLYGAVIFVPASLVMLFAPIFEFGEPIMQIVCIIYALIISLMVGKSIANFVLDRSILNLVIMIGSILFCFSDIMLLFSLFTNIDFVFGLLCIITYYPAEYLLAHSILKSVKK